MTRQCAPEAEVEGRPRLLVREEDREAVTDILADMLIGALERHGQERPTS
jgi:hypothetical protein